MFDFLKHIKFASPNPLGAGLAEEIADEQAESDAFTLDNYINVGELQDNWQHITEEFESDPEWAEFMEHN